MITAPYNFVPLNEKIFYPPWASEDILKNIHDVPFKDGESGVIEVEITAKSPIFIKFIYKYKILYFYSFIYSLKTPGICATKIYRINMVRAMIKRPKTPNKKPCRS